MPSSHDVSTRLGRMSQSELETLFEARPWSLGRQHDLHDLADTLLSAESIVPALRRLARPTLMSLRQPSADMYARDLLLADVNGTPYPEVSALLPSVLDQPAPTPPPIEGDSASITLHSVVALRDLVEWMSDDPIPMGATGGLLKVEEKMLAVGLVVSEEDTVAILRIAERAGLVRTLDRRLYATTRGMDLLDDLIGLWRAATTAVLELLDDSVRAACATVGRLDQNYLDWLMPLRDATETAVLRDVANGFRLFGVTAGGTTDLGRAVLDSTSNVDDLLAPFLPELRDSVYVLDDLSIIAPGPVSHDTSNFLETIATLETRGLAPKRRLDPSLILRAVAGGTTVESIVERLSAMSLTPVSAAVSSTIEDIARNGRFVVLHGTGTDTAAKASHPELGAMLLTDPRLQRLAPVKVDDLSVLFGASRIRVETALLDNRYTVVSPASERVIVEPAVNTKRRDLAAHLHETGLGSSHLERALVTAGKSRSRVTLLVETSTGNKTITLEPRHVANGRVRGLDTVADVERTLPISAIIELLAVGE